MATIKDIAKQCNVTVGTVSKALNNDFSKNSWVGEKTRAKIKKAASELGYVVDDMARAVKIGKSRIIGVISNSIPDTLMQGFISAAEKNDYSVRSFPVSTDRSIPLTQRISSVRDSIISHRLPGIIIHYSSQVIDPLFNYFAQENIPCVVTSSGGKRYDHPIYFLSDDRQGGSLVAQYFIKSGYRNFLCVYDDKSYAECLRAKSFSDVLAKQAFPVISETMTQNEDPERVKSVVAALRAERDKPLAVFCATDSHALTVLTCALSLGLKVPEDVSIIGYGNTSVSWLPIPPVSTVEENSFARGQEACSALIEMMKGPSSIKNKNFAVELVLRRTCV